MFTNTQYFREAALDYERNARAGIPRYTLAPIRSKEWYDYWNEQKRRCLNGYRVGDVSVTGKHYFYMNFCRIRRVEGKGAKISVKEEMFPAFWQIDYDWFWYKEIAWWGCDKDQLDKLGLWRNPAPNRDPVTGIYLNSYGGGKHLSCLKTRRAGFSFKEAADGTYIYNFIPDSKCYYLASKEDYLIKDGILNKVEVNLNWLNQHTDGFWLKNRMRSGTLMHQKASYIDLDDKQEKGYFSEIIGVTVAKDPDKARGKDGIKITLEEAGSFPDLKPTLDIIVPSVRDGSTVTGQISVFGTGGEEGQDIEGLDEVFNDPHTYDMLPFINDWEEYEATECGVYIPCYMANNNCMDLEGNVDIVKAIAEDDLERAKKKKAKDPKALDRRMAEFSRTPTEALIRIEANNFCVAEAKEQLNRVMKTSDIQAMIKNGELVDTVTGVEFRLLPKDEARPILKYPHKKSDDIDGCYTEAFPPDLDENGKPVADLYFITFDPYYDEEAQDVTSLFAFYVTKRFNNQTPTHNMDVAWFSGRPAKLDTCYEILFKAARRYGAKIQGEIGGGGKGVYDYGVKKKMLDYMDFTPINISNKEHKKEGTNRTYLMTISTDDKTQGLTYYMDYLTDEVCIDQNGNVLKQIHFVYDVALLWEIIKFSRQKNCDRISAQIIKMFVLREKRDLPMGKMKKRTRLSSRRLFSNQKQDTSLVKIKNGEVYI